MERTGVHEYEAEAFIEKSLTCSHLDTEGIFTHFANSELNDLTHAKLQLERFQEVLNTYEKRSVPHPPIYMPQTPARSCNYPKVISIWFVPV